MHEQAVSQWFKGWARRARNVPVINRLATSALKRVFEVAGVQSEVVIRHLHRVGACEARLPNGRTLRLWSDGDDFISNQIFWHGWDAWEPETTTLWYRLAQQAEVIFDVGAHVGTFALIAAHANPKAKVFAFEPLGPAFERLAQNHALNALDNLQCVRKAVCEQVGTAQFFHVDGIPSSSSLSYEFMAPVRDLRSTMVETTTLDAFAADHRLEKVDLIKMDTESTEPDVVTGMKDMLARCRPNLIIEVLPEKNTLPVLISQLSPLGYEHVRLVPRTGRDQRITRWVSNVTARKDPFDNFLFSTQPIESLLSS